MKVLHVGIFKDHCLGADIIFKKGWVQNGFEYEAFDYRSVAAQSGISTMNQQIADAAHGCDVVFIGKGELVQPSTLQKIHNAGCIIVLYYGDARPVPEPWLIENLRYCDVLFMSSAGETLKTYFIEGKPGRAAFYLNPSDPELPDQYRDIPVSVDRPLYTGTTHSFMGKERLEVYNYLCQRGDVEIVGSPSRRFNINMFNKVYNHFRPVEYVRGDEYIKRIIRCRFGVGVSAFQNIKYYTSDRLTHYLTFGKLFLAYEFPGCNDLFENKKEIHYYSNIAELDKLIGYYSQNQEEAEQIGSFGQEKILTKYNVTNIVNMMVEIIEKGNSFAFPWVEIYK